MTRFLILLAMAFVLAIWFVVADIRRSKRARDARRRNRIIQAERRFERSTCDLSFGVVHYDLDVHYQGHLLQTSGSPNSYEPLSA